MPFPRTGGHLAVLCAIMTLGAGAPAATATGEDRLLVFAAASTRNAMDEVAGQFETATGHAATLVYAGSSALARQIRAGAPADIFISANTDWMDSLQEEGLVDPATRFDLAGNTLVLVGHGRGAAPVEIGPDLDLADLLGDGRLAMALVDAVPAGIYGRAALTSLGLWDDVAPRIAQTDNVRAALALVAAGEAPLGIVYATDAAAGDNVTVLGAFPADSHPPIVYPAAAVTASANPLNPAFLHHLRGAASRRTFRSHGFAVPGG